MSYTFYLELLELNGISKKKFSSKEMYLELQEHVVEGREKW